MGSLVDVSHCNMALSALGISTQIQSITPPDPGSEQAKVCAFWYPICRDQALQEAPWNFAYTYIAMASDASSVSLFPQYAIPGWNYAYQYPADCLQPIAVCTYQGIRFGPAFWASWWFPYPVGDFEIPKIPFKVMPSQANPGQLMILTDIPSPAYLFYIQQNKNTAMYDPLFSEALSLLIAAKIGGPLRTNPQKVADAMKGYKMARDAALAQHLNSSQQDRERPSPSVLVRN